ncbi:MAG: Crp/Fnr family transcriptional regulator [Hyphomicrobiaceae bacterium]
MREQSRGVLESLGKVPGAGQLAAAEGAMPAEIAASGVMIGLRPRQRLAFGREDDLAYVVTAGVLEIDATPRPNARQVLEIYYRGDLLRSRHAAGLPGANLIAASRAEVCRIAGRKLDALAAAHGDVARWIETNLARQVPRRQLHLAAVGSLTGEERVASFLVELALRIGEPGYDDSRTFDMPLSRTDMAHYLALNADTLSRIMSRLRQSGVLGTAGRGRGYTPNLAALAALTPLADVIRETHEGAPR